MVRKETFFGFPVNLQRSEHFFMSKESFSPIKQLAVDVPLLRGCLHCWIVSFLTGRGFSSGVWPEGILDQQTKKKMLTYRQLAAARPSPRASSSLQLFKETSKQLTYETCIADKAKLKRTCMSHIFFDILQLIIVRCNLDGFQFCNLQYLPFLYFNSLHTRTQEQFHSRLFKGVTCRMYSFVVRTSSW